MALLDEELDLQYSCSKWSTKELPPEKVLTEFVRISSEESNRVRDDIPHNRHVRYGGDSKSGNRQLYDIYGTDLPKDSGIVVFIHGGYWQSMTKDISANIVRPLYNAGFKVIVADYDLCPHVTLEVLMNEIEELFMYVVSGISVGPAGVWLVGHSAGAHLCSMFLNPKLQERLQHRQKHVVRGLILISGVYDLKPIVWTSENRHLSLSMDSAEACSTYKYFDTKYAGDILIVHGKAESPEFYRQSRNAYQKALHAGTACELLVLEDNDHFTIIEELPNLYFALTRKILKVIKKLDPDTSQ